MKDFKCPNCGGEIKLDENQEFGFCMYCGSKIKIKDEIKKMQVELSGKVELTGKVEIDDSKKTLNFLKLAEDAFNTNNYTESYKYYTKYLENDMTNYDAILKRGACSAYKSRDVKDGAQKLVMAVNNAIGVAVENGVSEIDAKINCEVVLVDFIACKLELSGFIGNITFSNVSQVLERNSDLTELFNLLVFSNNLLDISQFENNQSVESIKMTSISTAINIADIIIKPVKYQDGYRQVRRGDQMVREPVYRIYTQQNTYIINQRNALADEYNRLPSVVGGLNEIDKKISELQLGINDYENSLNEFLTMNPQIKKNYNNKSYKNTGIAALISLGISVVFFSVFLVGNYTTWAGILWLLFLAIAVISGIVTLIEFIVLKRKSNQIFKDSFDEELKGKNAVADRNKEELKNLYEQRQRYCTETMKVSVDCNGKTKYFGRDILNNSSVTQKAFQTVNGIHMQTPPGTKNKWIAFLLCLFLGCFGAHKFYEEKIGMGILYFFTAGLFCIGWIVDIFLLLLKPNPYYVS